MKLANRELRKDTVVVWKVLSFMALDAEEQQSQLGPTENWYCTESEHRNPGANYLLGLCEIFTEYFNSMWDDLWPEINELERLKHTILHEGFTQIEDHSIWSAKALGQSRFWVEIRKLARSILEIAELHVLKPDKPIRIEDYLQK